MLYFLSLHAACTFVDCNCTGTFSASPRERLRQVLATRVHIPSHYQQAIATSTKRIAPRKYIFVTAVSSNHYQEMQGLVRSVHQDVFPRLTNYSFVFFDLGLTPLQRNTVGYLRGTVPVSYTHLTLPTKDCV